VQALNGAVATRSIRLDYGLETSGGPNGSANDTNNTLDLAFVQPNLAPSGADATIVINEDSPRTLVIANFGYTDADGNALLEIRINSVTGGTLTVNGTPFPPFPLRSRPAQLNAGQVVFTPTQDLNGSGAASIAFQVRDNGGTASGGIDTDQSANTITFNITAVNDAPAGANNGASVMDNATHVFTVADFSTGLTDANDSPPNSFAGVRITTLPPVQAALSITTPTAPVALRPWRFRRGTASTRRTSAPASSPSCQRPDRATPSRSSPSRSGTMAAPPMAASISIPIPTPSP
jgi:hypothetical protein